MNPRRVLTALISTAAVTTVAWAGAASATDHLPGRFTGGGRFYSDSGVKMTHGFELHCDVNDGPNNLEVNWNGHQWHLEDLTWASCSDRPNVDPAPPPGTTTDVYNGHGYGRLDGVSGAYADWRIIDKGEPGTKDRMQIIIYAPGSGTSTIVIQTVGGDGSLLDQGNHQSHKV